jgi:hypothetical protein
MQNIGEGATVASMNGQAFSVTSVGQQNGVPPSDTNPYSVRDNRMVYGEKRADKPVNQVVIADFNATIVSDINGEHGSRSFLIEGRSVPRGTLPSAPFEFEIGADKFSDPRQLCAALTSAAGAHAPIRAGMEKHLRPAIQLLSGNARPIWRFERTGWAKIPDADGHKRPRFLMPGRESAISSDIQIQLDGHLAYGFGGEADLSDGLSALESLIQSQRVEMMCVVVAFLFAAPLSNPAGWRNERSGLMATGRTGTFKTSIAQVGMCLYGQRHIQDDLILKWGEGATRNAIMRYATYAHDLPFLIDNYKPTTGGGANDFVNLMHNILEGRERARLNRASELKESRSIFCWPFVTGEDVPDSDPASIARILTVPFKWQRGEENAHLQAAQDKCAHLQAVGSHWIQWLEGEDGQKAALSAKSNFTARRAYWASALRQIRDDQANIMRVATNLAVNELAWQTMAKCPITQVLAERYMKSHTAGLEEVSGLMAHQTAESLEGTRFVEALRALLSTGSAVLAPKDAPLPDEKSGACDRIIGFRDNDGSACLIPQKARQAVDRLLGSHGGGLGSISARTLHAQLDALGMVRRSANSKEFTSILRTAEGNVRVLKLHRQALDIEADNEEE